AEGTFVVSHRANPPPQQGRSWRDVLPIHPAAKHFPPMSSDELKGLGADIIKNGLASSIALWRADPKSPAQLLDGCNRLNAIEMATGKPVEIGAPSIMAGGVHPTRKGKRRQRPAGRA